RPPSCSRCPTSWPSAPCPRPGPPVPPSGGRFPWADSTILRRRSTSPPHSPPCTSRSPDSAIKRPRPRSTPRRPPRSCPCRTPCPPRPRPFHPPAQEKAMTATPAESDRVSQVSSSLRNAHVFITGVTGFVGQAVLEKLLSAYPTTRIS